MTDSMKWYMRQIRAILLLPFTVTVVIPVVLWYVFAPSRGDWRAWPLVVAMPLGAVGLGLLVWTIRLFIRVGQGTLAPWNPTKKLVITGPYAYVRNPMLTGVFMILLAEAIAVQSGAIALWFGLFVLINAAYFPLSEEPGLRKRFGAEYEEYCRHVPRFWPRRTPWVPGDAAGDMDGRSVKGTNPRTMSPLPGRVRRTLWRSAGLVLYGGLLLVAAGFC